jgi:lipoprotein-anchoring transpeptidase ErfK/SrfK
VRIRPSLLVAAVAVAAFAAASTAFGSPLKPAASAAQLAYGGDFVPAAEGVSAESAPAADTPAADTPAADTPAANAPTASPAPAADAPAASPDPASAAPKQAVAASAPAEPAAPRPFRLARVRGSLGLSDRPGGPATGSIGASTEFGSAQVLGVAAQRGKWLGVVTSARDNGRLAWVRRDQVSISRTRWSLHADLSKRTLTLRRNGRGVKRLKVAIGRPGSDTPTGRFAITDKLPGTNYGPYYGCCILALSGHQPNLPPGWTGGNRLAIHGTDSPSTIGTPASAGCLRAADADLRVLMDKVPLGTPVFIRH